MNDVPSASRRKVLGYVVAFLAGIGATLSAIPFIRSWRITKPPPTLDVDVTKMIDGQLVAVTWKGRPIYILKRGRESLQQLMRGNTELSDPSSSESVQPLTARNLVRSIRPEFLVVEAVCTHLGCSVGHVPPGSADFLPEGGFYCPCHGSKYDLAGRVMRNLPAPANLVVPPYKIVDANTIRIGQE